MPSSASLDLGLEIIERRRALDEQQRDYLKALARFDEAEGWHSDGCTSLNSWLQSRTGLDGAAAATDVAMARRLYGAADNAMPGTAAALEAGEISLATARGLERGSRELGAEVLAESEDTMVDAARRAVPGKSQEIARKFAAATLRRREIEDERARRSAEQEIERLQAAGQDAELDLAALQEAQDAAAAAEETARLRAREEYESRYLRQRSVGRMVEIEGRLSKLDAEIVFAVLEPFAKPGARCRELTTGNPEAKDTRTQPQRWADALTLLARRAQASDHDDFLPGPIGQVQLLVDLDEGVERTGINPISSSLPKADVDRLLCDASLSVTVGRKLGPLTRSGLDAGLLDQMLMSIAPALGGIGFEVLEQGRKRRLATAAQIRALVARDRGCVVKGCDCAAQWCEAHHWKKEYQFGGLTDLDDLALVCPRHHTEIHLYGLKLKPDGRGGFDLVKGEPQ